MKDNDLAIVVNTHSSCKDIWPMFFGELERYLPYKNIYVFTNELSKYFEKHRAIIYDPMKDFRTQYYSCIRQIKEPLCINLNDDYILSGKVDELALEHALSVIRSEEAISQIRLLRGFNGTEKRYSGNLYYLNPNQEFFYSQTMAMWKTRVLEKIHELCPPSGIGRKGNEPQLEVIANLACRKLKLEGLYYYDNEPKRGAFHYDSSIVPHIASALVSGKWNTSEYRDELNGLFKTYRINPGLRGTI